MTAGMTPFDENGISSPIYRNNETGEETSKLPVGALYATRRREGAGPNDFPPVGYDGLSIVCRTIDGNWYVDSRASNCTKPEDKAHRCWVRHGTVGEKVTVDKNGNTCAAGAGSFFMDGQKWHGFLRNGIMVQQ